MQALERVRVSHSLFLQTDPGPDDAVQFNICSSHLPLKQTSQCFLVTAVQSIFALTTQIHVTTCSLPQLSVVSQLIQFDRYFQNITRGKFELTLLPFDLFVALMLHYLVHCDELSE